MKLINKFTAAIAVGVIMFSSPLTVSAGIGDYYTSDNDSVPCGSNGGTLYSHTERQTYGTVSGNVHKYKFYVYSQYNGSKTVERIRCTWKTGASLRNSASMSLSISTGKTYSVDGTSSSTWTNTYIEKYWEHSTGTKVSYEQSNFTVSPNVDYRDGTASVTTTSSVKLKGDAKSYAISSGC